MKNLIKSIKMATALVTIIFLYLIVLPLMISSTSNIIVISGIMILISTLIYMFIYFIKYFNQNGE